MYNNNYDKISSIAGLYQIGTILIYMYFMTNYDRNDNNLIFTLLI